MRVRACLATCAFGCGLLMAGVASAQSTPPPPAAAVGKYITAAEIAAGMKKADLEGAGQTVPIFLNQTIRRRSASEPNNASVHPDFSETYQILAGSGTFMTGGTMPDPKNRAAGIRGGVAKSVSPGDWIVIPAGTPHWFSRINGTVTYVETRLYPGNKGATQ